MDKKETSNFLEVIIQRIQIQQEREKVWYGRSYIYIEKEKDKHCSFWYEVHIADIDKVERNK